MLALFNQSPLPQVMEQLLGPRVGVHGRRKPYERSGDSYQVALRFPGFREERAPGGGDERQSWHIDGLGGVRNGKGIFGFDLLVGVLLSDLETEFSGELCYYRGT